MLDSTREVSFRQCGVCSAPRTLRPWRSFTSRGHVWDDALKVYVTCPECKGCEWEFEGPEAVVEVLVQLLLDADPDERSYEDVDEAVRLAFLLTLPKGAVR